MHVITYFVFSSYAIQINPIFISGLYMGVFLFFGRPVESALAPGVLGLCKFNGFLWSFTAFTTPTLLSIASGFRFMAIYMPYSYKDKVTFRNATVGMLSLLLEKRYSRYVVVAPFEKLLLNCYSWYVIVVAPFENLLSSF